MSFQVNLFLSEKEVTSENFTEAMVKCQANPIFPTPEIATEAQESSMTLYLIIGFAALIFIILLIIVVSLVVLGLCL